MTNNDILRRIRYTFDFDDTKMIALFALADHQVSRQEISDWLKKDDDLSYQECSDINMAIFLNGLINDKRGKKPGAQVEPEELVTNNVDFRLSKHELSAFFRKPAHKNYRLCKNQILRNFLSGMQLKYKKTE
jgi:uncharacterized protein YehS (DUF1456 family)